MLALCQLGHVIGQEFQAENSFPYDHTESRVTFLEKVV